MMALLKAVSPSFKEKKRYVVYKIEGQSFDSYEEKEIQKELMKKIYALMGLFDSAEAGLIPLGFFSDYNKGIIKVNVTHLDLLRTTFTLIKELFGKPVLVYTVGVSGILNKARKKYLN